MTKLTTEEKILTEFIKANRMTNEALFSIRETLKSINDQNLLHCRNLEKTSDRLLELSASIKSLVRIFQWVIVSLVLAIVALAGAEKLLKFLPLLSI